MDKFKKILVFMNVSAPDLVAPGRAALESLEAAIHHTNTSSPPARDYFVRVLVSGYQLKGRSELDAVAYHYEQGDSVFDIDPGAPYVPGDPSIFYAFVRDSLALRPKGSATPGAAEEDAPENYRALLVIWGHGEGVGNAVSASQELLQAHGMELLPVFVDKPNLLTIGDVPDQSLPDGLRRSLDTLPNGSSWKFDLAILDSCMMASAEVAYEFRSVTRFVLASQALVGKPGLDLGRAVVEYLKVQADDPSRALREPLAVIDAAKGIVGLVGDRHSGAAQLTLFRVEPCPNKRKDESRNGLGRRTIEKVLAGLPRSTSDGLDNRHFADYPWLGLFWAFTQLLRWASADAAEQARIATAFKRAFYCKVRQFIDLRDLAAQVHQYSREKALQIVALELMRELEERDDGLVVRWRAVLEDKDKQRFGGVSIYCPWFAATGLDDYDVLVDQRAYESLDLPRGTGWSSLVLGSMYQALRGSRAGASQGWSYSGALDGKASGALEGKASGALEGKASGALEGKASGALEGKASGALEGKASGALEGKASGALEGKASGALAGSQ